MRLASALVLVSCASLRSTQEPAPSSVAYEQPAPLPPGCVVNSETGELQRTVLIPIIVGKIVTVMPVRQKCIDSAP